MLHLFDHSLLVHIDAVALVKLCAFLTLELFDSLSQDLLVSLLEHSNFLHDFFLEVDIASFHMLCEVFDVGLHDLNSVQHCVVGGGVLVVFLGVLVESAQL